MSSDYDRSRRRPGRMPPGARPRRGPGLDFEDADDAEFDDAPDLDDEPAPARRGRPAARPRGRPAPGRVSLRKPASSWSLFGSKRGAPSRTRRREGFDWDEAEGDEYEERPAYDDRGGEEEWEEESRPRRGGAGRRPQRRARATLMDLCTPVFGFGSILPREPGGIHPSYEQFRQEVLAALQRIESAATEHGIEKEDAQEARYALALYMDEQVAESEWTGKVQWASEPLSLVLLNDPEGGVNFFNRLDRLGDRQREVKKIYLVCLALGYRGKYIELEPSQQAARIGEVRQKVLRTIQPPLENQEVLFPEAYEQATPLEGQAPPPPRFWLVASLGTVAALLVLWLVLFWEAGRMATPASEKLRRVLDGSGAFAEPAAARPASASPGEDPS